MCFLVFKGLAKENIIGGYAMYFDSNLSTLAIQLSPVPGEVPVLHFSLYHTGCLVRTNSLLMWNEMSLQRSECIQT